MIEPERTVLLEDDFSSYEIGRPVVPYYGLRRIGPWETRNIDYLWDLGAGGFDAQSQVWGVERCDGRKVLSHTGINFAAYICAGEDAWRNYLVAAEFAFEKRERTIGSSFGCNHDQERMLSGLLARYQSQRHHYFWGVDADGCLLLARRTEEDLVHLFRSTKTIAEKQFHRFALELEDFALRAYWADRLCVEVEDHVYSWGRVGFRSDRPLRVARVQTTTTRSEVRRIEQQRMRATVAHRTAIARFRPPNIWRQIKRGAPWHNVLVADVNRDGHAEIIHANVVGGDDIAVELLDLNGQPLWRHGPWSDADAAGAHALRWRVQGTEVLAADLLGTGRSQIVVARGDRVLMLDGIDGRVLAQRDIGTYQGVDALLRPFSVGNLLAARLREGNQRHLIAMNGEVVYALDTDLKTLWFHVGNLGHAPQAGDLNGDGFDEVMCGYSLHHHTGKMLWSVPGLETRFNSDMVDAHADWVEFGRFHPADPQRIALAASQKGFYLLEIDGQIVSRQILGHAQLIALGKYDNDLEGRQFLVGTLWESAGIYWLLDARGKPIRCWELGVFSPAYPLRWAGEAADLILLGDYDRCPAILDAFGRILWQADLKSLGAWRRLHKQGFCLFRTAEFPCDLFAATFANQLILFAP
ncbi:MAG: hypothetical protein HY360_19565 [Verrucomicrobia bacterium]|nr:hypothetical protein [Verrucomicrobiota bacterium]